MSQYGTNVPGSPGNGSTCDVNNGDGAIQLNNIDATAYIDAGDLIAVGDDVVSYEVDGVTFGGTHTSVSIVGTYGGSNQSGASYVVNTGFTVNRSYARPDQGDVRGLLAVRAALLKIDEDMVRASQATAEAGTDAEQIMPALRVHQAFNQYGLGTAAADSADLNNETAVGKIVGWNSSTLNAPTSFGILFVGGRSGSFDTVHIGLSSGGELYSRRQQSGGWTAWQRGLNVNDLAANGGTVPETGRQNDWGADQHFNGNAGAVTMNAGAGQFPLVINQNDALSTNRPGARFQDNGTDLGGFRFQGSDLVFGIPWFATHTTLHSNGGLTLGSPSGGAIADAINAPAVYDDGTLLTDYPLDAAVDGVIDTTAYDAAVPNREIVEQEAQPGGQVEEPVTRTETVTEEQWDAERGCYVRRQVQREVPVYTDVPVLDEEGNEVGRRRVQQTRRRRRRARQRRVRTEERVHQPCREFAEQGMDELDPAAFAAKWQQSCKLPAFQRLEARANAAGKTKLSIGESHQALLETCEVQAVHIHRLQQQIEALTARLEALGG